MIRDVEPVHGMGEVVWQENDFPFLVGACRTPRNPEGLPDTLPLHIAIDRSVGILRQVPSVAVEVALARAYDTGSLLGTAMDDTVLGRPYAEDFLRFVEQVLPGGLAGCSVLEIGAGRGYLLRRLREAGATVIGIEPGTRNGADWARHGVDVVCDRFPSPKVPGRFDLIVGYGVFEHMADPASFLEAIRDQLSPDGLLILSVPDCGTFIETGDPSMLVHEHYAYLSDASLRRLLLKQGFQIRGLEKSGHGSALYVAAEWLSRVREPGPPDVDELTHLASYGDRCVRNIRTFQENIATAGAAGQSIGIFSPARALAHLPKNGRVRFFDDDPELTGRYYPPFPWPIENRAQLLNDPVDELWIMSRSFGAQLQDSLVTEPALRGCSLRLIDEVCQT